MRRCTHAWGARSSTPDTYLEPQEGEELLRRVLLLGDQPGGLEAEVGVLEDQLLLRPEAVLLVQPEGERRHRLDGLVNEAVVEHQLARGAPAVPHAELVARSDVARRDEHGARVAAAAAAAAAAAKQPAAALPLADAPLHERARRGAVVIEQVEHGQQHGRRLGVVALRDGDAARDGEGDRGGEGVVREDHLREEDGLGVEDILLEPVEVLDERRAPKRRAGRRRRIELGDALALPIP